MTELFINRHGEYEFNDNEEPFDPLAKKDDSRSIPWRLITYNDHSHLV